MNNRLGTPFGNHITGTIRKYNSDGTVLVALDQVGLSQPKLEFNVPLPVSWVGNSGEFLAGYPKVGTQVRMSQGQGGEWFILGYKPNPVTLSSTIDFSLFKPGRLLGQVKDGNFFYLDSKDGFLTGSKTNYLQVDSFRDIISSNLSKKFEFNSAIQKIEGEIARDLSEDNSHDIISSFLQDHKYDDFLYVIGMDPSSTISNVTTGSNIRNPALNESKEIFFEFDPIYNFISPAEEVIRYNDPSLYPKVLDNSRRNNRTDAFSLSLYYPNQLIESIKGTGVDIFGNILDINRNILPIGKLPNLSLHNNINKADAFRNITSQLRKSLAFHWELNARKEFDNLDLTPPGPNDTSNFDRKNSKFYLDIDKEGQIKINMPSSSEQGNIALPVHYQNYSTLLNQEDPSVDPNSFIRPNNFQDIYLNSFAANANIKLVSGEQDLDGYASPIDRLTNQNIKFGTMFHDILKVCNEFQKTANYLQAGLKLINWDENCRLNRLDKPLDKVISDSIIVSGDTANGGGRSLTMFLEGMANLNIGANTVDKQSLWLDTQGGIVSYIDRDKQGISWASHMAGDVIFEIGGVGLSNSLDTRFKDLNDSYRNGKFEIRVNVGGQLLVLRMAEEGISIMSPGTITLDAQQDIILKSNSNILMEAESIVMYAETSKRIVNRTPAGNTLG